MNRVRSHSRRSSTQTAEVPGNSGRRATSLVLLFGQQQSRIAAMTTDQVTVRGRDVFVRFGQHELPVPEPLGDLLLTH